MIKEAIEKISQGQNLNSEEMRQCMEEIMTGRLQTPQIVIFLEGLNKKGESIDELTAAVQVMRRHSRRINIDKEVVLDTCGTGGDKKGTFNVSTVVAFVAAGLGITIAKHGNRSVSSSSGSADILEALGVNINMTVEQIERCLEKAGIAFLFAPNLHPAMKYAMPARKQIGKRTMFNLLGPLTNPAGAKYQLIGVFDGRWTEIMAGVLGNLGTVHALVVHGADGLDELTTTEKTFISEIDKGRLSSYQVIPEDFGIKRARLGDLSGGGAAENALILTDILKGETGPRRDIVILNSAAAIYAADKAASIKEAVWLAADSIDSGKALEKVALLKEYSYR